MEYEKAFVDPSDERSFNPERQRDLANLQKKRDKQESEERAKRKEEQRKKQEEHENKKEA